MGLRSKLLWLACLSRFLFLMVGSEVHYYNFVVSVKQPTAFVFKLSISCYSSCLIFLFPFN